MVSDPVNSVSAMRIQDTVKEPSEFNSIYTLMEGDWFLHVENGLSDCGLRSLLTTFEKRPLEFSLSLFSTVHQQQ